MVLLHDVSRRYGAGRHAVTALVGVSLGVKRGGFLAVTGPSGSGKSTLLNLIAGIDEPDTGRIVVCGHDLRTLSDDRRSDLRLRQIGIVFQAFNLLPSFTVEENVLWPLTFQGVRPAEARARVERALDDVMIAKTTRARRPADLSGGEQQRVAIARALVTRPSLLLADEPTGNLDSETGDVVLDLLCRANAEQMVALVLITHSEAVAARADEVIVLRDGRVVGDPSRARAADAGSKAAGT
jgi:putative ABC transport system ATP-binding protein